MRTKQAWADKLKACGVSDSLAGTVAGEIVSEVHSTADRVLRKYAWFKEGVQYVGHDNKVRTLQAALEEAKNERD